MVTIPRLGLYSPSQWEEARSKSRALAQYERLLQIPSIDNIHKIRHEAWIECVLATYFGTTSTENICTRWSQLADQVLTSVWHEVGLDKFDAVLFALGKHGAQELNLSSDIDVLLVADPKNQLEVERRLRVFQQRIHTPTEFGFCFRLDFDLRPGGKMGPIVTSPSQFQDYYWSQGETWERLALVRLRPLVGSKTLGQQIGDLARRFSYRKFLDYTLLEDLKALRAQVHQKGFIRKDGEVHIKLEVGGIRDIELFVHSLQVLNGGKLTDLQTRSTDLALQKLAEKNLLATEESQLLRRSYWHFRHLENWAQSIDDRQTHALNGEILNTLGHDLEAKMSAVDKTVSTLLGAVDLNAESLPATDQSQLDWLEQLGFTKDSLQETWQQLISATALSYKNDRDERARREFLHTFVTELSKHKGLDRDLGLRLLVDFVKATRAKATFFSMLLRTPKLVQDLSRLFCLSPYLSSILTSRPELLDHFILRVDETWSADMEPLLQQMSERKLLTEIWGANQFIKDLDLKNLFLRVTQTADEVCMQLLSQLQHEFPDSLLKIVALGKWGGGELGLRSDLDFIFVTPSNPTESDYKVARRFISRLTDPLRGGNLYEIDLRLRPSGQSGALLVAQDSLVNYWRSSAKVWERQAYLRARTFNIDLPTQILTKNGLTRDELLEIKSIREKLFVLKSDAELDLKYMPGGLIDIEFTAQTAILNEKINNGPRATAEMIKKLSNESSSWNKHGAELIEIYENFRKVEQMLQLTHTYKTYIARKDNPHLVKSMGLIGIAPKDCWILLQTWANRSRELLDLMDPAQIKRYHSRS